MNDTYRYAVMGVQEIKRSFRDDIESALHRRHGPAPDPAATERVWEEWAAMEAAGDIGDVAAPLLLPPVPWRKLDIRPAGR